WIKYESESCSRCWSAVHTRLVACWPSCARRIISGKAEQTKSTSSVVESRPSEKRTSELASSDLPIARITCDGSIEPAEQAEPLDAQIPSTSNPASKAML